MPDNLEILIRPALSSDAESISVILRELGWFHNINKESSTVTEARILSHLQLCSRDNSHIVLVAENQSGEVVGYIAVHWLPYLILPGPEGFISELFVRESYRGRGIGHKLLAAVKEQAIARGCSRLMLLNRRDRESYKRGFYQKLGYNERVEFANLVLHLSSKH